MAPPVNRRSGNSRRAQYSRFYAYVAAVLGVLVGGYFLLTSLGNHAGFSWARGAAADVTEPVARVTTATRAGADSGIDTLAGFATWGSQNAQLKREVALARVQLAEAAATADENRRLKDLLHLSTQDPHAVATAWMVASSNTSSRRYATISAGSNQGVRPGMAVRTSLGLVGRVLETGHFAARVLLITDSESKVPVRRASDGTPAFAQGLGDGTLQIQLLTLGINPLKPGDAFVASGSGGLYWPGTPIAVVTSVTRDGAIAHMLSDPGASELVEVEPLWNPMDDPSLPAPSGPPQVAHPLPHPAKPAKPKPAHKHWL